MVFCPNAYGVCMVVFFGASPRIALEVVGFCHMWALDKSTRLLAGALKHGATLHPQHQTLPGIASAQLTCFESTVCVPVHTCTYVSLFVLRPEKKKKLQPRRNQTGGCCVRQRLCAPGASEARKGTRDTRIAPDGLDAKRNSNDGNCHGSPRRPWGRGGWGARRARTTRPSSAVFQGQAGHARCVSWDEIFFNRTY